MFPTFHLKWGPQYGSPSPSCQAHLLCSSESDVRTLVPGEEWRKLCQNVVQHGLVSTHFNQLGMWKSVHIRFFLDVWIATPHPSYPQLGFQKNSTEHHWLPSSLCPKARKAPGTNRWSRGRFRYSAVQRSGARADVIGDDKAIVMWVKQCHKPTMTGNGKHTTYKNGDDWGWVYCRFIHII